MKAILKTYAANSLETLEPKHKSARRHVPEGWNLIQMQFNRNGRSTFP